MTRTAEPRRTGDSPSTAVESRDLLVFEFEGALYGVEARKVDTVIGWREPVPLPQGGAHVRGVLQDRGRIVTVLRHPAGAPVRLDPRELARIVVCATSRGHLGLPATVTRTVGPIELRGPAVSGAVVDTSRGALTFIDPDALLADVLERSRAPVPT